MLACQSYFPLCDECLSGHSFLASREECDRVSIVECEKEWTMAKQYGIPLPNCTNLPEQLIGENNSDVVMTFAHLHECTFVQDSITTIGRLPLLYNPFFLLITCICTCVQRKPNLAFWELRFQGFVSNCESTGMINPFYAGCICCFLISKLFVFKTSMFCRYVTARPM